ncbi:MAG: phosphoribosyl-ATP diphosphatase [Acidobacteria bacterium]|nr:phosphoribosyl-ATP diphosphatase [Acidobacteriota bacterium]
MSGTDLSWLWRVLAERRSADPEESYTARLLAAGPDRVAQKVGEEAVETVIAAMRVASGEDDGRHQLVGEAADLVYHLLVLLLASGVSLEDVTAELEKRHRKS